MTGPDRCPKCGKPYVHRTHNSDLGRWQAWMIECYSRTCDFEQYIYAHP